MFPASTCKRLPWHRRRLSVIADLWPRLVKAGIDVAVRRRKQAERSATTRQLVLDAAIKSIVEHGYGATTTSMVAEEAGISRGAMLHQFPSKADLMTFVVEAVFEEGVALYSDLLAGVTSPKERVIAYPEAVWKVLSRPGGIAVLEILQGTRSDTVLAEKLAPVQARIDASAKSLLQKELYRGPSVALMRLIVGVVHGLSIGQVIAPDSEADAGAIKLLQKLLIASGELDQ